jgi:thymidylate synthase (FAD)
MTRPSSDYLDSILGKQFPVLDDGFVRVIDYMGDDAAIVQAARVSYGEGTKHVSDDRGLIRYLMRHKHTTPFEMCELKLHVRVPMDTWRQWIRHRTASVNEYSTRYSEAIDSMAKTAPDAWRIQAKDNKQGSAGYLITDRLDTDTGPSGKALSMDEAWLHMQTRGIYERRLAAGVAREQARKDLPLSTYTEAYWKIDVKNLLNFLQLRLDSHAQLEIRQYAETIWSIIRGWLPLTSGAFVDYVLEAVTFSRQEQLALLRNAWEADREAWGLLSDGEKRELAAKIERIRNATIV